MQETQTNGLKAAPDGPDAKGQQSTRPESDHARLNHAIPYIYLTLILPVAILLVFLTPPMQPTDEGRHFFRAYQIALGHIVSQMNPSTHEAGGWLPTAVSEFVHDKMTPDYFRAEDKYHTISQRLRTLETDALSQRPLSEMSFAAFPNAAIYSPSLYLTQSAGIALARAFSSKVYVSFYLGRLLNAISAILVIFVALRLAPGYWPLLVIPAILPMSLFQISSLSSDAELIALSILFVALCLRFSVSDSRPLRCAIVVCLILLVTGKPVYLPLAALTLAANGRIGWRRAILFSLSAAAIAAGSYAAWSKAIQPFVGQAAGQDFHGYSPHAQVHIMLMHPISFLATICRTLRLDAVLMFRDMIGIFGWVDIPLPRWLYEVWVGVFLAIFWVWLVNRRVTGLSKPLWGSLAAVNSVGAIFVAAFVIWTPVGSDHIPWVQGRYFIPILPIVAFAVAPLHQLGPRSKKVLPMLVFALLALFPVATILLAKHYYFDESSLLGQNVNQVFTEASAQGCPAEVKSYNRGQFSGIAKGRASVRGDFRVLLVDDQGIVKGESDSGLADNGVLDVFSPRPSGAKWLIHAWNINQIASIHYVLVTGDKACTFGPVVSLKPYFIPPV